MSFKGKEYTVITLEEAVQAKPDLALFSAGGATSLEWAPKFEEVGTVVIDNSSAWRMNDRIKLIVPEINGNELKNRPSHYRQSELFYYPDGIGIGSFA